MDITAIDNPEQFAQVKLHLRVDGDDEDALIEAYIAAGIAYIEQYCDRTLVEELDPDAENEMLLTGDVWAALLLLVGHWYANREAAAEALSEPPLSATALLWLRRAFNN